jgi:hypothetical protein
MEVESDAVYLIVEKVLLERLTSVLNMEVETDVPTALIGLTAGADP